MINTLNDLTLLETLHKLKHKIATLQANYEQLLSEYNALKAKYDEYSENVSTYVSDYLQENGGALYDYVQNAIENSGITEELTTLLDTYLSSIIALTPKTLEIGCDYTERSSSGSYTYSPYYTFSYSSALSYLIIGSFNITYQYEASDGSTAEDNIDLVYMSQSGGTTGATNLNLYHQDNNTLLIGYIISVSETTDDTITFRVGFYSSTLKSLKSLVLNHILVLGGALGSVEV